jgi:hypothetical protein
MPSLRLRSGKIDLNGVHSIKLLTQRLHLEYDAWKTGRPLSVFSEMHFSRSVKFDPGSSKLHQFYTEYYLAHQLGRNNIRRLPAWQAVHFQYARDEVCQFQRLYYQFRSDLMLISSLGAYERPFASFCEEIRKSNPSLSLGDVEKQAQNAHLAHLKELPLRGAGEWVALYWGTRGQSSLIPKEIRSFLMSIKPFRLH